MHFLNEELQFASFLKVLMINSCLPPPSTHQEPILPQTCDHGVLNHKWIDKFQKCTPTSSSTISHLVHHGGHSFFKWYHKIRGNG
jgi:hypothetical protein